MNELAIAPVLMAVIWVVATAARLIRGERPCQPRQPVEDDMAVQYLRGQNEEAWRQLERERLRRSADELARKAKEL